jgi:hypothetical protein
VYAEDCPEFNDWMINCSVELRVMHHFKDYQEWGYLLLCFCNEEVTSISDFNTINESLVNLQTNF